MSTNLDLWDTIRPLCRDQLAFEQIQQLLGDHMQAIQHDRDLAQYQIHRQQALFRVIARLRQPLELEAIFQTTAAEVRQLLSADRVGMFRFYPDANWNDGEFVSEDVDPAFEGAIAHKIHDHCFGEQFAPHYQAGRVQNIADIHDAGLSPCHIDILAKFQVRANLVVPLLQGDRLWGLLCIHQCRAPRQWQDTEIEFVQQIANHLSVALQHAELLVELRAEITERQQAEQRAQALNKSLQQAILEARTVNQELESFSYSVSHDLRAPLRGIDGFSQALLEDYHDQIDLDGQDYLNRIRSATQRMGQLIDDLLTLSRVTRIDMHRASVDLSAIAQRLCQEFQQLDSNRSANFTIAPNLIGSGDAHLLQVVLENLLNNAWKFTNSQTRTQIEFGAIDQTDSVPTTYFVRDNGVGFDMAFLEKLFKPFQRLHAMHAFPGNGIGLATVQRIIHRHGGQVWAEGWLGQGATFYFTLATEEAFHG
jgi:light-regulated signal transduction histidine kinase (bacteriophytochrome)